MSSNYRGEEALAAAPIGGLMLRLAVPAVAAQLINMLYNIVDRIYIGHIPVVGKTALTGLGVSFPILMLVSAFAAFSGMGGAPLASIRLGAGDRKGAEQILGNSTTLLLGTAAVLTVFFSLFKRPLLMAFGASEDTVGYALEYLSIYLLGTVFVQLALGLNTFISAQGKALTSMLSVLIGAVLNIVLDPIFIFGFQMGVRGAALATILSQAVSACWVVGFLCTKRSGLRIRLANMALKKEIVSRIAALGVAPFIMQSTESLVTVVLNSSLQTFGGDLYVGTLTIMQSVMQMVVMPVQGITQGTQPIMSYNFGAKKLPAGPPGVQTAADRDDDRHHHRIYNRIPVPRPTGPDLQRRPGTGRSGGQGHAGFLRRDLGLWGPNGLSDYLHGAGPGQDQPVSCPVEKGDPFGASCHPSAPNHQQRNGGLYRRAGG